MKTLETDTDVSGSSLKAISPIESDLEYFQRLASFELPTEISSNTDKTILVSVTLTLTDYTTLPYTSKGICGLGSLYTMFDMSAQE